MIEHDFTTQERIRETGQHLLKRYGFNDRWLIPEHDELFAAIAKGEYKFWDAEKGAKSTMTSILGRMATYSGQVVEWDKAMNCGLNLQPSAYTWDTLPQSLPDADGFYKVAVPGVTKFY